MQYTRTHPEQPSEAELQEARNVFKRSLLDGKQVTTSGACFGDPNIIGVRQALDILNKKSTLTPDDRYMLWAVNIEIEDIDYYYRYEKDYGY